MPSYLSAGVTGNSASLGTAYHTGGRRDDYLDGVPCSWYLGLVEKDGQGEREMSYISIEDGTVKV